MKSLKYLFFIAVLSAAFVGCTKESTCTCTTVVTDADGNQVGESVEATITIEGDCSEAESSATVGGITTTTTCN